MARICSRLLFASLVLCEGVFVYLALLPPGHGTGEELVRFVLMILTVCSAAISLSVTVVINRKRLGHVKAFGLIPAAIGGYGHYLSMFGGTPHWVAIAGSLVTVLSLAYALGPWLRKL